ncbi:uncharacterized protein EAF01_007421 [Botrytis porri]|nr:uncharacterized protein EAF01_007421 [Botrytis porri]KAF7902123.1 hypothetical protein EAF01_007421 [Botrytis porri]
MGQSFCVAEAPTFWVPLPQTEKHTVPQQPVNFKNTDLSSNGGSEDGTGKRNLELPKQRKHHDTWCTWLRDPKRSNEVERPIFSFSEVITNRYLEQNQIPRVKNDKCVSPVPPGFASLKCLAEIVSDHNFSSSPEQGIKTPYPVHELDEILIGNSAPRPMIGRFIEPQSNLIDFEVTTTETRSTEDWRDPWMLFGEPGSMLLDGR